MSKIEKKMWFLFYICFFTFSVARAEKVVLSSLNWEPYIGQNLKDMGYVAKIAREAYKVSGHELEIKYYTWARTAKMAQVGQVDGYFPEYYAKNLEDDFYFSDPFPGGPLGFFKRKGSEIEFTTLDKLRPYTIGVVRGYINEANFDAADYLTKQAVSDDLTNIKKLLKNRIDLFVADKFVGFYLLDKNLPHMKGQMVFVDPPLENKDLYVCFSRKLKKSRMFLDDFNKGLKNIKESGRLEEIMKEHGF